MGTETETSFSVVSLEWQATFDAISDLIFVLDRDFHILRFNKAAIEKMGVPAEQIKGMFCWEVMHDSKEPHPDCPVIKMNETKRREKAILEIKGILYEASADPIFDSAGEICGVVHILSDVTDRINSLRDARETHLLYQDMIDNHSAGMYRIRVEQSGRWDHLDKPPFMYEFINDRFVDILGLTREKLVKDPSATMKLVHPDDLDEWIRLNQESDRNLGVFRWQGRFVVNGQIRWLHFESRPRVMSNNDRIWTGILLDISDLKKTQESLHSRESLLSSISSNLSSGMIYQIFRLSDGTRKFTYLSDAVERLYGVSALQAMADPDLIYSRVHPDDIERVYHEEEEAYKSLAVLKTVVRMLNPDGSIRWSSFVSNPVEKNNGSTCWNGIEFDISDLKKSEDERVRLEESLRHAEKIQAIGQLAGGIAHDFNNQLMGVMGYAQILYDALEDPELRDYTSNILTASRRGSDLTRKLLAFSRKGKYTTVPVDVHSMIEEVVKILQHSIDKKIGIKTDLQAVNSTVSGDPTQIQNALLNLALNSRDAIADSGEIRFLTENMDLEDVAELRKEHSFPAKGPCIRISVEDSGAGMDGHTMSHLFEPFFSTKPPNKGSGMGLASVYGTVKSHKGFIFADSTPGNGSVFSIFLPVVMQDARSPKKKPSPKKEAPAKNKASILVADDDEIIRTMLSKTLSALGHKVTAAKDGAQAVEIYKSSPHDFDLVILDMIMPGKNGKDAFFEMRRINKDVKALIISGYSVDKEVLNLLDHGLQGFIQKPFEIAELAKKISSATN